MKDIVIPRLRIRFSLGFSIKYIYLDKAGSDIHPDFFHGGYSYGGP